MRKKMVKNQDINKSAKFHGEGLMQSRALDELLAQDFHLYRISWECVKREGLTKIYINLKQDSLTLKIAVDLNM